MSEPLPERPAAAAEAAEAAPPELLDEVFFAPLREVMCDGVKRRSCKVLETGRSSSSAS